MHNSFKTQLKKEQKFVNEHYLWFSSQLIEKDKTLIIINEYLDNENYVSKYILSYFFKFAIQQKDKKLKKRLELIMSKDSLIESLLLLIENNASLSYLNNHIKKYKLSKKEIKYKIFLHAILGNNNDVFLHFINMKYFNVSANNNFSLCFASAKFSHEIINHKSFDYFLNTEMILIELSKDDQNIDLIKQIINKTKFNPYSRNQVILKKAIKYHSEKCVEYFLSFDSISKKMYNYKNSILHSIFKELKEKDDNINTSKLTPNIIKKNKILKNIIKKGTLNAKYLSFENYKNINTLTKENKILISKIFMKNKLKYF